MGLRRPVPSGHLPQLGRLGRVERQVPGRRQVPPTHVTFCVSCLVPDLAACGLQQR